MRAGLFLSTPAGIGLLAVGATSGINPVGDADSLADCRDRYNYLGPGVYVETRAVDVHIRRLRKALNATKEAELIRTERSAGYALDARALG